MMVLSVIAHSFAFRLYCYREVRTTYKEMLAENEVGVTLSPDQLLGHGKELQKFFRLKMYGMIIIRVMLRFVFESCQIIV